MGIATSLTAARMEQIEQSSVTGGSIDAQGHLILETKSGATIDAGKAKGEEGDPGQPGPPGPPAPDSGFVDRLSIGTTTNWSVQNYTARKLGGLAVVNVAVKLMSTAGQVTADSAGNIPDVTGWLTLPVGWQNSSGLGVMVPLVQSGLNTWWGRINTTGGTVDLTHASFPGQKLTNGDMLYATMTYWVS